MDNRQACSGIRTVPVKRRVDAHSCEDDRFSKQNNKFCGTLQLQLENAKSFISQKYVSSPSMAWFHGTLGRSNATLERDQHERPSQRLRRSR